MLEESTFIDVSDTPELLPKPPDGAMSVPLLFKLALGALEVAGATPDAVLSTFSSTPALWPLPPRLAHVGHMRLGLQVPETSASVRVIMDLHDECRAIVSRLGVGPRVYSLLASRLSGKAANPLVFTPTQGSAEAADLFTLEFMLAVGNTRSKLVVQSDSVVKHFLGRRTGLSLMRLNKRKSPRLTAEWVDAILYKERGTAVYGTFDCFDRCLLWAEKNVAKAESGTLRLALAWLKLHQDKEIAYDFEQALLTIEPFVWESPDIEYAPLLYTHESLNLARDLWLESDKEDYEAFRDFYEFLVPTYLDDEQFRRMFKTGMVLEEDFTEDIRRRIDAGMMNFAAWFLKMMRKYDRK